MRGPAEVGGQGSSVVLGGPRQARRDAEAGGLSLGDLERAIDDVYQPPDGRVDLAKVGEFLVFNVRKIGHDHVARDLGLLLSSADMNGHGDRSVRGNRN